MHSTACIEIHWSDCTRKNYLPSSGPFRVPHFSVKNNTNDLVIFWRGFWKMCQFVLCVSICVTSNYPHGANGHHGFKCAFHGHYSAWYPKKTALEFFLLQFEIDTNRCTRLWVSIITVICEWCLTVKHAIISVKKSGFSFSPDWGNVMESQMSNEQIDTELYDLFVLFVFFALSLRVWFDALYFK